MCQLGRHTRPSWGSLWGLAGCGRDCPKGQLSGLAWLATWALCCPVAVARTRQVAGSVGRPSGLAWLAQGHFGVLASWDKTGGWLTGTAVWLGLAWLAIGHSRGCLLAGQDKPCWADPVCTQQPDLTALPCG